MVLGFFHAFSPNGFPYFFPYSHSGPGNALNKLLHPFSTGPLHFLRDMPINVQGKGGGMVSEITLNRLNIVPGPKRDHGVAMPEVVQTGFRQTNRGYQPLVIMIDRIGRKPVSHFIREHKSLFLPERAGL